MPGPLQILEPIPPVPTIGMPGSSSGFSGPVASGVKENTEGAKFWMKVFNDLKTRGVADILIAVTDGLLKEFGRPRVFNTPLAESARQLISGMLLQRLMLTPIGSSARVPVGVATPYASMLLEAREGEFAFHHSPWAQFRRAQGLAGHPYIGVSHSRSNSAIGKCGPRRLSGAE